MTVAFPRYLSNVFTSIAVPFRSFFFLFSNRGITHVFHAFTFVGYRGSCLNTRRWPRVQSLPRDQGNVTSKKKKKRSLFLYFKNV